jgi:hypothetical protein
MDAAAALQLLQCKIVDNCFVTDINIRQGPRKRHTLNTDMRHFIIEDLLL